MRNLKTLHLLAIPCLFLLSSCALVLKSYVRNDTENVPPDFGKEKTTILVVEHNKSYNKKVDEIFKKYYKGDYLFITDEELKTKYSDTTNYRYLLDRDRNINRAVSAPVTDVGLRTGQQSLGSNSSASISFNIWDRKAKKYYDSGVSSGTSWKSILKAWLSKLEEERKKNGSS